MNEVKYNCNIDLDTINYHEAFGVNIVQVKVEEMRQRIIDLCQRYNYHMDERKIKVTVENKIIESQHKYDGVIEQRKTVVGKFVTVRYYLQ